MGELKDRFKLKADALAVEIKEILKEHGSKKIGEVTLSQIYQGMRGKIFAAERAHFVHHFFRFSHGKSAYGVAHSAFGSDVL